MGRSAVRMPQPLASPCCAHTLLLSADTKPTCVLFLKEGLVTAADDAAAGQLLLRAHALPLAA